MRCKVKRIFSYLLVIFMVVTLIPASAYAKEEMSDEFKAILNEDGKFVMNTTKPTSEYEAMYYFWDNEYMWDTYADYEFSEFNEDYTSCLIKYKYDSAMDVASEEHWVDIVYNYDEGIKAMVTEMVKKIPEGKKWVDEEGNTREDPYYFSVSDMELISYWYNTSGVDDENYDAITKLLDYSGEFKKIINYKNFVMDARMGNDSHFYTECSGYAPFKYDDVLYTYKNVGVLARHVIYVPDETGDTREELMAAAQKRIDEYLGKGKAEIIGYGQGILDCMTEYYYETIEYLTAQKTDYESSIAENEEKLAAIDKKIEEANARIAAIDAELAELNSSRDGYNTDKANYELLMEECILNMNGISDELGVLYNEDKLLVESEIEVRSAYIEENQALYDAEMQKDEAERNTDIINGYNEAVTALATANEQLAEINARITELENSHSEQSELYNDYQVKINELQINIDNLNEAESQKINERDRLSYNDVPNYETEKQNIQNNINTIEYNIMSLESDLEQTRIYLKNTIDEYNDEEGFSNFLKDAAGDYYFTLSVGEYAQYGFVVIRDSDKMISPEYKSSDVKTDVTVGSVDGSIPLDTLVSVDKLTSGEVYNKLMEKLNVKENLTFDISLYSNSLEKNITKLESGEFSVRIPVSEGLKGKSLTAYYVDSEDKVHEYTVKVEDDYAVFATNHFSIYTLAEKTVDIPVVDGTVVVTPDIIEDAIVNSGGTDVVDIPMPSGGDVISSVELPVESIDKVAEAGKGLSIETTVAKVSFDNKALGNVIKDAGTAPSLTLKVEKIKEDKLTVAQKVSTEKLAVDSWISAELYCVGELITGFGGGTVTLEIPFETPVGMSISDYSLAHIDDDGFVEKVNTRYREGFLIARLHHFSEYAIINTKETPLTGDDSNVMLWIGMLMVSVVAVSAMKISKKNRQYN